MNSELDIIERLTSSRLADQDKTRLLNDFSQALGWRPSDHLDTPALSEYVNANLLVEHGLLNSAVISFIKSPLGFDNLPYKQKNDILSVSYNNLVDWHILIENETQTLQTVVYNRVTPIKVVDVSRINAGNLDLLRAQRFETLIGRKPNPNLKALDDALIETVSHWKRLLHLETNSAATNESLATLFNSLIFVRAVEDQRRFMSLKGGVKFGVEFEPLREAVRDFKKPASIQTLLQACLRSLVPNESFVGLIDFSKLAVFNDLDPSTVRRLVEDFYLNKYARVYRYDFSLISKQALSRIYEHYVSILREKDINDYSWFPAPADEVKEKTYGSIYTPQFIARFFVRFIRDRSTPVNFRKLISVDPACGSGMFLRTMLEFQCDLRQEQLTTDQISSAFERVHGFDLDANACEATKLSLSLLHLVLTDRLPKQLNVERQEAISYAYSSRDERDFYDVVFANPPFVSFDTQTVEMRQLISEFMGDHTSGRPDLYLPFLLAAVQKLKPGGYGAFVLPHSFVLKESDRKIRELLEEKCDILCLADLSQVPIFDENGSYVILLIFRKRINPTDLREPAIVVLCSDFPNDALSDALVGRFSESASYSVYATPQNFFRTSTWTPILPKQQKLIHKFESLPSLFKYCEIRQGFNSGCDPVFIVPSNHVPSGEKAIYVSYMPDKAIEQYVLPEHSGQLFFYPYINGDKVTEDQLQRNFPQTWSYLLANQDRLKERRAVVRGTIPWWIPERARTPEYLMVKKILTPHLVLIPRFALDIEGKFAVSRAPFICSKDMSRSKSGNLPEVDLLKLMVAILNSSACFWYIAKYSHIYGNSYNMLEPKTLKRTPVPDLENIDPDSLRNCIRLVDRRLAVKSNTTLDDQIDEVVCEWYGVKRNEDGGISL